MKKGLKVILPLIIVVIGASAINMSMKGKDNKSIPSIVEDVKEVGVMEIKSEKISSLSEYSGTLQPTEEVMVSFELGGSILSLERKEGDVVKAGEVIAYLDDKDYQEKLQQAEASVRQADAGLKQVMSGAREQEIQQAKSTVDKVTAVYNKTLEDLKKVEENYQELKVSKTDYDNAKYALEVVGKDLEVAKQGYSIALQGARSEVKAQTQAGYDLAKSGRNQVSLLLGKTKLKAPIDGTIIQKLASTGQLVGAGTPIYKLGNISNFKTLLPVPDYEISKWKIGDTLEVSLYDTKRQGVVTNILPSTNQSTGTVGVEVQIENPNNDWIAGQIVKCVHSIESKEGIYVPVSSVINTGNGNSYVFVAKDNIAIKVNVKTGALKNNKFEIVEGLKLGDVIISKGNSKLLGNEKISKVAGDAK